MVRAEKKQQKRQQQQQLLDILEQRPEGRPGQVLRPWTPPATSPSFSTRGGSSQVVQRTGIVGGRRPFSPEEQGLFPEIEGARGRTPTAAAACSDRLSTKERGSSSLSSRPTAQEETGTSRTEEKETIGRGGGVDEEKSASVAHDAGVLQRKREATHMEGVWERPGTSPVKAGPMRHLMSYSHVEEIRPMTSPVRSRRPRNVSPVKKTKKKKEEQANQPFYRGLFGVKGSRKKIGSSTAGDMKTRRPRSVQVNVPRRRK